MTGSAYIEVEFCQRPKHGQFVPGDVFLSRRIREEERVVSVLSDGLGSGVKASVLATLTATMAVKYTSRFVDIRKSAETIMDTLPVCRVRKISYSTFSILDVGGDGEAQVMEHGNPPFVLMHGGAPQSVPRERFALEKWKDRPIEAARLKLELGDRLVVFSDGLTQSGIGQPGMPLGWGQERAVAFVQEKLRAAPDLSARRLCQALVERAVRNDRQQPKDDISCAVISLRQPRRLLVMTGPPFDRERDGALAEILLGFPGRKAICGGTTASIVSRALRRPVRMRLDALDPDVPPASTMEGVDLITEGTLTLARVAEMLERETPAGPPANAAGELLELMLESDIIDFVVGTRINEAHQDPNIPVELDLRRNVVKKLAGILENRFLKETRMQLV